MNPRSYVEVRHESLPRWARRPINLDKQRAQHQSRRHGRPRRPMADADRLARSPAPLAVLPMKMVTRTSPGPSSVSRTEGNRCAARYPSITSPLGVLSIDWSSNGGLNGVVCWEGVFAESGPHAHRNLRSRSARYAPERRSKSDLVSAIGSPISTFATESCATYLMTLFPRMTPPLFISESAMSSTSLRGLESLPARDSPLVDPYARTSALRSRAHIGYVRPWSRPGTSI
jgi:hypothetical protein